MFRNRILTNNEHLQDFISTTIANLEHIRANGANREYSFDINCSDLEDYNYIDIRKAEKFSQLFTELAHIKGPTLYRIEILSDMDRRQIIEALNAYKASPGAKVTPALRPHINYDSNTLYVGKVKQIFWGRLIQHLGYFKVDATQGLQLFYWAKGMGLTLRFHIMEFDTNMADSMPIIEMAFAKKFDPIIGKHK
ncbi:hypothetical protein [Pedobacter sp. ASV28]|uniref:hypothetical protein n=1 Tax=Pedobacter sp. ASV28 TaxID=2795123 RepID=UPI0018ECA0D0|nr:hypothetical protein [Pedobacter sp. ASV28]